jgi:hypothetical protein
VVLIEDECKLTGPDIDMSDGVEMLVDTTMLRATFPPALAKPRNERVLILDFKRKADETLFGRISSALSSRQIRFVKMAFLEKGGVSITFPTKEIKEEAHRMLRNVLKDDLQSRGFNPSRYAVVIFGVAPELHDQVSKFLQDSYGEKLLSVFHRKVTIVAFSEFQIANEFVKSGFRYQHCLYSCEHTVFNPRISCLDCGSLAHKSCGVAKCFKCGAIDHKSELCGTQDERKWCSRCESEGDHTSTTCPKFRQVMAEAKSRKLKAYKDALLGPTPTKTPSFTAPVGRPMEQATIAKRIHQIVLTEVLPVMTEFLTQVLNVECEGLQEKLQNFMKQKMSPPQEIIKPTVSVPDAARIKDSTQQRSRSKVFKKPKVSRDGLPTAKKVSAFHVLEKTSMPSDTDMGATSDDSTSSRYSQIRIAKRPKQDIPLECSCGKLFNQNPGWLNHFDSCGGSVSCPCGLCIHRATSVTDRRAFLVHLSKCFPMEAAEGKSNEQ